jgi:hypothetical protein
MESEFVNHLVAASKSAKLAPGSDARLRTFQGGGKGEDDAGSID